MTDEDLLPILKKQMLLARAREYGATSAYQEHLIGIVKSKLYEKGIFLKAEVRVEYDDHVELGIYSGVHYEEYVVIDYFIITNSVEESKEERFMYLIDDNLDALRLINKVEK